MEVVVRSFRPGDAEALGQVFHRAVHEGAAQEYSESQRAAWSPKAPSGEIWAARLIDADTVVAEHLGQLVGFMSLISERRYLDLAFVVPEAKGQGVAAALYAVLEGRARAAGLTYLTVEASLLGEPFFARQGYSVVKRQSVFRKGERLPNCVMEKDLIAPEAVA